MATSSFAKLVNITRITIVYDTQIVIFTVDGVKQLITGGHHPVPSIHLT